MPKFAANLTMMFNEWDFLDRFTAARTRAFPPLNSCFLMLTPQTTSPSGWNVTA